VSFLPSRREEAEAYLGVVGDLLLLGLGVGGVVDGALPVERQQLVAAGRALQVDAWRALLPADVVHLVFIVVVLQVAFIASPAGVGVGGGGVGRRAVVDVLLQREGHRLLAPLVPAYITQP